MEKLKGRPGFTLIEVTIAVALFVLFALGVYSAWEMVFKVVYKSRVNIIETALIDERIEVIRNLPYDAVGLIGGIPVGYIPHTTTTYRNGIPFLVTTVIRSVDDPFDGTLGGSPNDTAPADYKIVEINIKCLSCLYPQMETTVGTVIPPRDLEGSTNNGAVFIFVSDSNGNPVTGANVHIENKKIVPNIIIDDVTDKDGFLRVVDVPTGTFAYDISVTKTGFSTDQTVPTSTLNPDPTKKPATISSQQITDIFFSIDNLGSLSLHTLDESCEATGNASFNMYGEKLIGEPDIKKYSQNLQTDSSGNLNVENLEYDKYHYDFSGSGYDVAGAIPMLPLDLVAGSHKDQTIILAPHTNNSLLIGVVDNDNGLPVSDATIELRNGGGSLVGTKKTNYGFLAQTDWSGGGGQVTFDENTPNLYNTANRIDAVSSPGNFMLDQFAGQYMPDGSLESSIFDIGKKVTMTGIVFTTESLPPETGEGSVLIQLAVSNSSTDPALNNFVGPDGTASTYYSSTSTVVYTNNQTYRYFRYRVYLSTIDQNFTPVFSSFALTFTSGCVPPGQVFYSGLNSGAYEISVSATGYDTATSSVDVVGQASSTINLHRSI